MTTLAHAYNSMPNTIMVEGVLMSNWGKVVENRARNHFAVVGAWQGKRLYFSQLPTLIGPVACKTEGQAKQLHRAINIDIERGVFNPARYQKRKPLHLDHYADKWLRENRPGWSESTYVGYEMAIRLYINPTIGYRFLPDVSHSDLKKVMGAMSHLSNKSKVNHLSCLHRLMLDAQREGHMGQLPPWIEFRGANSVVPPPIYYLTVEMQQRILEEIPERHRHIFLFMMSCGCRPSEARALKQSDIHWEEEHILFQYTFGYREEYKKVKAKRPEPFPLYPELRGVLEATPRTLTPWVFLNPDNGKVYNKKFNGIWHGALKASGVPHIQLYQAVRHSYACQLLNAGVEKAIVSRLLRHNNPRHIERYVKYETTSLKSPAGTVRRIK